MAVVVQDLVTKFSFMGSLNPLAKNNVLLGGAVRLLGFIPKSVDTAAVAFAYFANKTLNGVDSLDQLSKVTKVAVADIQTLNYAAGQTQSTAGAMESSLRSLSSTIGSAAQKGSEDFARLGISVRDASGQVKNADVILDEVRQRFQQLGLSMQEQEHFASALGIDSSLIQLLGKTNSEMATMRDRARELGTLTAEQTQQADLYKKSLNSMWFSLNSVKQLVAVGVAPELSNMADSFAQLLADNKGWIVDGIQFAVEWIGNLLEAFNRLIPFFAIVGAGFFAMKVAALGFGGAMALVFSPAVLIAAAIVAVLLIVDDLIVAMDGGKSVIADFFQEFFGVDIVPVIQGIIDTVVGMAAILIDVWTDVGDFLLDIFGGVGKALTGDFTGAISDIWDAFVTLGSNLYDKLFAPLFDWLGGLIAGLLPDWALKLIGVDVKDTPLVTPEAQAFVTDTPLVTPEAQAFVTDTPLVAPEAQAFVTDTPLVTPEAQAFVTDTPLVTPEAQAFATATPPPAPNAGGTREGLPMGIPMGTAANTTNSVVNNNRIEQNVDIGITTNEPEAAGRAVGDTLQRQLDNANTQFATGGR